jgi:uncharacterized protein (DUF427 family)
MAQDTGQMNSAPGFRAHPEHAITIEPYRGRVQVHAGKTLIADSANAVVVRETNHSPVFYIPMDDIRRDLLRHSPHTTRCPFKGTASYWNVVVGDHEIDNALWAYETPYDEMLELAGLASFYESKVSVTATPA